MAQPTTFDIRKNFHREHDKVVELILFRATSEWSEEWLNAIVRELTNSYILNTAQDIIPFFNRLAHYAYNNSASDDGSITICDIRNFVEEAVDELENAIWDTAYTRLCEREGEPQEVL